MRDQAMELVANSAIEAGRRLQFYRLAFGAAAGMGSEIGLGEARQAAEGLFMQGKVRLVWPPDDGVPVDKAVAKLLLNMVLIGGAALMRGGTLSVQVTRQAGTLRLSVSGAGERAKVNDDVRAALAGEVADEGIDAHNVQPWYTRRLAKGLGSSVDIQAPSEGQVTLSATV
jgi:histidine phosphotransferase ChpT